VENASDVILTLDRNGMITMVNRAFYTLLGYSPRDVIGKSFVKFVKKGEAKKISSLLYELVQEQEKNEFQIELYTDKNEIRIMESSWIAVGESESCIEVILRDVTSRRLQEEYRKYYIKKLEEEVEARTTEIKETQRASILAIANLAESIELDVTAHLERIRSYAKILAEELRKNPKYEKLIDDAYIELIYDLSPLHDVGKVGIRDEVLLKPGKLTEAEFEIMKGHTEIGAKALRKAGEMVHRTSIFSIAEMIANFHHERWDGTGYPKVNVGGVLRPLKGEEIPLCARIVAVADVYDAITSKRPYKDALPHEIAKNEIIRESGKYFDPDVVDAFLRTERDFIEVKGKFLG
jgi:PAS domain S-box-containing protein